MLNSLIAKLKDKWPSGVSGVAPTTDWMSDFMGKASTDLGSGRIKIPPKKAGF